jgi:hypothetical protein
MTVEMKITHQRHGAAHFVELLPNGWNLAGGLKAVHRNANDLGACKGKVAHLNGSGNGIGRIGIGHGLHHDRRITTNKNLGVGPLDLHLLGQSAR